MRMRMRKSLETAGATTPAGRLTRIGGQFTGVVVRGFVIS